MCDGRGNGYTLDHNRMLNITGYGPNCRLQGLPWVIFVCLPPPLPSMHGVVYSDRRKLLGPEACMHITTYRGVDRENWQAVAEQIDSQGCR